MATPQRKMAQAPIRVDFPVGNLTSMPSGKQNQLTREEFNRALQISNVLQTTLEVERIIELFSQELQSLIPHDGLHYHHKDEQISCAIGKKAPHSCTYKLVIGDQSLGELGVLRKKRFITQEMLLIEYLLCSLVYPLRNALMYRSALQAALQDPLTGVNNRAAMETTLTREIELARRHGTPLSLIAVDIDRFKSVNDQYGHIAGDCVIKSVADRMNACIRSSDILFRYGGEEFVIVLSNTGKEGATMLAERIRKAISDKKFNFNQQSIDITVSQGIGCLGQNDVSKSLFIKADTALYKAKAEGRDCVKIND